jgi:hypothetical protein
VFTPAARVPLAGLLLAIPALQATGLLPCATQVFGGLPNGFYGLDTMLLEGVLRALAGEPGLWTWRHILCVFRAGF